MDNIDEMTYDFNIQRRKFDYCKTGTICSVEGCFNPVFCKGYCTKHYAQIQHYGKIITTIYDKNEIIEKEDHAEIIVRKKDGSIKGIAIIDLDDVERCKRYKWGMYSNGYFYGNINKKLRIRLHRFIINAGKFNRDNEVDHINRNPADNRKCNLRLVNHSENNKNKDKQYSKILNYDTKNVYYDKNKNKYYGRFGFKGITYTTNTFNTEQEAIDATIKLKKEVNKKHCNIAFSF